MEFPPPKSRFGAPAPDLSSLTFIPANEFWSNVTVIATGEFSRAWLGTFRLISSGAPTNLIVLVSEVLTTVGSVALFFNLATIEGWFSEWYGSGVELWYRISNVHFNGSAVGCGGPNVT